MEQLDVWAHVGDSKRGPNMKANGRLTALPHFYVLPRASPPSGGVFRFSLSLSFFFFFVVLTVLSSID